MILVAQRIHIIGPPGSGKTTVAATFARETGIHYMCLDNCYYTDAPRRIKRDRADRQHMVSSVTAEAAWITEGIFWQPWVEVLWQQANHIILLVPRTLTLHYRVTKRHLALLSKSPISEYSTFLPTLLELWKTNQSYANHGLAQTRAALEPYASKLVECRHPTEARAFLNTLNPSV